jgi:type II secretory pathway component PulF
LFLPALSIMAIHIENQRAALSGETAKRADETKSGRDSALFRSFGASIKPLEVTFFISQLSLMLEIGTPLSKSLWALSEQIANQAFRDVIQSMARDIEEGRQLSDAMRKHPRVFSSIFSSMVKAGEIGGFLKQILDRIVEVQQRRQALKTQLRSALTYPIVLCVVAVLVVTFVLIVVLPKFTAFFEGKESVLPFTTRFLMSLSASMKDYWWLYLLAAASLGLGLKLFKESQTGHAFIDRLSLSGPIVGRLSTKIYTSQFLRTLGNLLESSVPLVESLEQTRGTIGNRYFRQFVERIAERVQQGGKFSQPFATYPYAPETVKQMVATGEETGSLPTVMLRLADFYDEEVERELKNLASMIEPLALIMMGGVVGLIVSSVILPIFKLASTVH